ncbi:histidine kinase N-terminal 7TM domain-containing protein [Halomontanus rarus]|uniref:histidine kinase N-terminal 7TM domain-containing protein n=1 Tax=Halomontanus rarus TaxID=3034020 RepID=UPI0023E7DC20|nr:histidine kinase N-terminal 7TM domain-containing protein [Halovivax sp. TS33]
MSWQHTIYAYPILFTTGLSLVLAVYAIQCSRRRGHTRTLLIFAAMNVAIAIWTGFSAIKLLSTIPSVQLLTYKLLYLGSSSVGPLLLLFVLAYTDRTQWINRRVIAGVFVVPIVYLLLLFTNPYDIVIVEWWVTEVDGLLIMRTESGPAHVAFSFTYALLIAVLTLGLILYEVFRLGRSYLPQASLMGIAIVTPMAASFLTSANVPPFTVDSVNYVPASTAVSSVALGIATFKYQLLELPPVAYKTVVKHSPDAVLVLNTENRIVHANESVYSSFEASSVIGSPITDLLPEFDVTTASDTVIEAPTEFGQSKFFNVRSQPLERHGEIVGRVFVLRDFTERRQRELDLEAFTSVVSHDLREPLRTTENYLQLLEDRSGESLDEADRELLSVAVKNNRRLQKMVSDLLKYSQIDSTEAQFRPIDCNQLVSEVLEGLKFDIEDKDAVVEVEHLPTVLGVEHLLRHLFQNLLANAVKYSAEQSLTITVSSIRQDGAWQFSVCDDGIGIEPEELEYVFDLFTRGSGAVRESGTGMGLAICKKIIDQHGGTIDIESTAGVGTEVTFTIPASDGVEAKSHN